MTGIIYGSTMGNTEKAAKKIAELIGDSELIEVSAINEETFIKFDMILLGSSTWGTGDLQDDWESKIDTLRDADLAGKKVGFFGCGDQEMYADSFVNALGTLYEAAKDSAREIVGAWPSDDYDFSSSTAIVDGQFVGLALDEDNQPEMSEERIKAWVAGLK